MATNGTKKPFKTVKAGNKAKSTATAITNRPQGPIKQTRNGGAASFKNKRNSENPNTGALQSATKSSATPKSGGGAFKSFLGQ